MTLSVQFFDTNTIQKLADGHEYARGEARSRCLCRWHHSRRDLGLELAPGCRCGCHRNRGKASVSLRLVRDLVSPQLLTTGLDTDITRVLYEEHVGTLPIIDENKNLMGLITRSDILKAIVEGDLLAE